MNKASAYFFPNRMGRIILESMEEVVGRNGLNAVLNLAGLGGMIGNYPPSDKKPKFSFEIVSGLMEKLEQAYGPRGGHGLAVRIGRTSFKYGMREFGPQMGLNETAFRFLPFSTKLRIGGQSLARKPTSASASKSGMGNCSGTSNVVHSAGAATPTTPSVIWRWDSCKSRSTG
jgi:hypothetical protein